MLDLRAPLKIHGIVMSDFSLKPLPVLGRSHAEGRSLVVAANLNVKGPGQASRSYCLVWTF